MTRIIPTLLIAALLPATTAIAQPVVTLDKFVVISAPYGEQDVSLPNGFPDVPYVVLELVVDDDTSQLFTLDEVSIHASSNGFVNGPANTWPEIRVLGNSEVLAAYAPQDPNGTTVVPLDPPLVLTGGDRALLEIRADFLLNGALVGNQCTIRLQDMAFSTPVVLEGDSLPTGLAHIVTGEMPNYDQLHVEPVNEPAVDEVLDGSINVPMCSLRMQWNDVQQGFGNEATPQLDDMRVWAAGSGNDLADISLMKLVLDLDQDGMVGANDPVVAEEQFDGDNGELVFDATPAVVDLPDGVWVNLLVVADFEADIEDGRTYRVWVMDVGITDLAYWRVGSVPYVGPGITVINPVPAVQGFALLDPWGRDVEVGAQDVVMARLSVVNTEATAQLQVLFIEAWGSGTEPLDVSSVSLVLDRNEDGAVNGVTEPGGDEVLDQHAFTANNGVAALAANVELPAGSSVDLLVVYDFLPTVATGSTFGLRLESVTTSAEFTNGLPLDSGTTTIVPAQPTANDDDESDDESPIGPDDPDADFGNLSIDGMTGCRANAGASANWTGWLLMLALALVAMARWPGRR